MSRERLCPEWTGRFILPTLLGAILVSAIVELSIRNRAVLHA